MLPNFLVIGAQKCATTSLCHLLGRHPEVFVCEPKEPHFFSREAAHRRGLDWYRGLFAGAGEARAVGEGSTTYTMAGEHPEAADRVAATLPGARLVYLVRDPVERVVSHWAHDRSAGRPLPRSLEDALDAWPSLLDNTRYWRQLERYRAHYRDERIHVLFFEDFRADPQGELARCLAFLGVDPAVPIAQPDRNWNPTLGPGLGRALARGVPLYRRLRGRISPRARAPLKRLLRPFFPAPRASARLAREIRRRLADDSTALLEHCGKPADFWCREAR